jgi:hypothetical protein
LKGEEKQWSEKSRPYSTWRRLRIGARVRVLGGALEAAGEAEEVVVEAVGRGGGDREMAILGDGGDGFVVVEIAAEVEGRGRRHPAAETPKGRGDGAHL